MNVALRLTTALLQQIRDDLSRRHEFALERVGFLACRHSQNASGMLLLGAQYLPVANEDYVDQDRFGAYIGPGAFRMAMEYAYNNNVCMLHVHRHDHRGLPRFSPDDDSESEKFVPNFWNVRPTLPHGTLLLSYDRVVGRTWGPSSRRRQTLSRIAVVGSPLHIF